MLSDDSICIYVSVSGGSTWPVLQNNLMPCETAGENPMFVSHECTLPGTWLTESRASNQAPACKRHFRFLLQVPSSPGPCLPRLLCFFKSSGNKWRHARPPQCCLSLLPGL